MARRRGSLPSSGPPFAWTVREFSARASGVSDAFRSRPSPVGKRARTSTLGVATRTVEKRVGPRPGLKSATQRYGRGRARSSGYTFGGMATGHRKGGTAGTTLGGDPTGFKGTRIGTKPRSGGRKYRRDALGRFA
jgi:hypothetical protein